MQLVKLFTRVLEFTTQKKLAKAQKRSDNAAKTFAKARRGMVISNQELSMARAEILIQLGKLGQVHTDIIDSQALADKKIAALDQFINTDFTNE